MASRSSATARSAKPAKITAKDIQALLRERFASDPRKYICASEVAITTGGGARRIDFCVMTCYASEDFAIEGIEIKVDPSDLRHEIQEHYKHETFFSCFDYYSIAVTEEALARCKDIVPSNWGIYIAKETKDSVQARSEAVESGVDLPEPEITLTCRRKPLPLETRGEMVPKGFIASFARKCVSDAIAPYIVKDRSEYDRGYAEGLAQAERNLTYQRDAELEKLQYCKELCAKLEDENGYFSKWPIEEAIELVVAMRVSRISSLYDSVARIHEESGAVIAALSKRFDLDDQDLGCYLSEGDAVDDEDIKKMIAYHDDMMDDIRGKVYGRRRRSEQ